MYSPTFTTYPELFSYSRPSKPLASHAHKLLLWTLLLWLVVTQAGVLQAQTGNDFLNRAVALAHEVQRETGVPSSVILAQAILETGWGRKPIPGSNNYFGLKAFEQADGTVSYGRVATGWTWATTQEWDGTRYVAQRERFRVYTSMTDSFHDLGNLYSDNDRYARAMAVVDDPRVFARRIAEAGYATAPDYADRLIQLMDQENLYQYDLHRDDAQFVDQSDYPTVDPGQVFEIYFETKNTGFAIWREKDGYSLVNVNDAAWGTSSMQVVGEEVAPEATKRWTIQLLAPWQAGTYRTAWVLQHGDKRFGPAMYIDVTVRDRGQEFAWRVVGPAGQALLLLAAVLGMLASGLWIVRTWSKLKF